jgi:hypothetical protein
MLHQKDLQLQWAIGANCNKRLVQPNFLFFGENLYTTQSGYELVIWMVKVLVSLKLDFRINKLKIRCNLSKYAVLLVRHV